MSTRPVSTVLALAVAACASGGSDLDLQRPPPGPPLHLAVTALLPGEALELLVEDATPGATVYVLAGHPGTWCPAVLGGSCMDLAPAPSVVGSAVASLDGIATVTVTPPVSLPVGSTWSFQAGSEPMALRKSQVVDRTVPAPCTFGDVLADVPMGAPHDQDNIDGDRDDHVIVGEGGDIVLRDFDLGLTGIDYPSPYAFANHAFDYDGWTHTLVIYQYYSPTPRLRRIDPLTGADVGAEVTTTLNFGNGYVDRFGNLNVVNRAARGVYTFDTSFAHTDTWAGVGLGGNGVDVVRNVDSTRAYKVSGTVGGGQVLDVYDLTLHGLPWLGSYSLPSVPGSIYLDLTIDENETLYLTDRANGIVYALASDGTMLGAIATPGEVPHSLHWNRDAHALYASYVVSSGVYALRKYCGW
ncbi:MAG: hypothetical protein H6733_14360 [Alphaproteobacteria bacterium]|nr:hypothetical protein [Alphaproteobacteria bacterium]